jgi:hypothetical protein
MTLYLQEKKVRNKREAKQRWLRSNPPQHLHNLTDHLKVAAMAML